MFSQDLDVPAGDQREKFKTALKALKTYFHKSAFYYDKSDQTKFTKGCIISPNFNFDWCLFGHEHFMLRNSYDLKVLGTLATDFTF